MATSPATFFPEFRNYLVNKLRLSKERVQIDVEGSSELKQADGKVLTLSLSTPKPYGSNPDPGAGRLAYQVTRLLTVKIATANTGDHGSDRERLLVAHWSFEDLVLNAIQQCDFKVLGFNRPPAFQTGGSEGYKHMKDVAGGLQSSLIFEITYSADITHAQPGPPV